ncbi:uncharacterized protein EV422DRAFT_513362 [Fimicolochytrium jonesii]|uniref:uncharacterized protein n=1 Tax=Fimicolochytrium jonesii TaxID=1396493 RepID=UPI0022FDE33B|nr:uncharacterized protein EV422DRAFT_513362 [Fimicolochytrium jonesii]KAI8825572.1 hypothetical protein EV422DRAFT_513362 [Fimicolochytrium jonesii]
MARRTLSALEFPTLNTYFANAAAIDWNSWKNELYRFSDDLDTYADSSLGAPDVQKKARWKDAVKTLLVRKSEFEAAKLQYLNERKSSADDAQIARKKLMGGSPIGEKRPLPGCPENVRSKQPKRTHNIQLPSTPIKAISSILDGPCVQEGDNLAVSTVSERLSASILELESEEVLINGVDAGRLLQDIQRRILKEDADISLQDTEDYLGVFSCLLITPLRPIAYQNHITAEDWAKLWCHFEPRLLPEIDDMTSLLPDVKAMLKANRDGRRWTPRMPDDRDTTQCARALTLQNLQQHLDEEEPERLLEPTWTVKHVVPLLCMLIDPHLDYNIDNATEASNLRPDVNIHMRRRTCLSKRALMACEIKSPWASPLEKKKDKARSVLHCVDWFKHEYHGFYFHDLTIPKVAVHLTGLEGRVYEVYMLPKMFVAVEVGRMTVPRDLGNGSALAITESILSTEVLMDRISKIKQYALAQASRKPGQEDSPSRLPPTPLKVDTKRQRKTVIKLTS